MRDVSPVLLFILVFPALAQEAPVPMFLPDEAWALAYKPQARMVDETTCERIEGAFDYDKDAPRKVVPAAHTALFRKGATKPFLVVKPRQDGVFVVRFPAKPFEVTISRSVYVDEESKRVYYGRRAWKATCMAGSVEVGDPTPADMDQKLESKSEAGE